jgi:glycosyltransferase involved in cell wall biosynthesis
MRDEVMRIAVIGVYARGLLAFRGDLLRTMAQAGHAVLAITPDHDPFVSVQLLEMGVAHEVVAMERNGIDPIGDLRATLALRRTLSDFRPDVTLCYAAKPVVFGSIAARLARVPTRSAMITGVGSVLGARTGVRGRLLGLALRALYAISLRQNRIVFFQNRDDMSLFVAGRLVGRGQRRVLIHGSGVNLDTFRAAPPPPPPVTFLFVGRIIGDKGIREFVEAARLVRASHPEARFQVAGSPDTNPTAIPAHELAGWEAEGLIRFHGEVEDVRPLLASSHVLVLPSYGEGMPRSVLEAMAMARAVIATDVPGCRDAVEDGSTGYLVPPRDAGSLAAAMRRALASPDELEPMGRAGRARAEALFDVRSVNRDILTALGVGGSTPAAASVTAPSHT